MRKSLFNGLCITVTIVCFIGLIYYFGIGSYFTLENLQQKSTYLKGSVASHYVESVLVFILVFVSLILVTLPIVGPMTMLGGYLFGVAPGFLYSLIASTIGSLVSFLIIRYLLASILRHRYKESLAPFSEKMKTHGYNYLLMLQLLSVVPFVVTNTLAALTDVSLFTIFWTTIVGSIPVLLIYAFAGKQLGTIGSAQDILSPQIMLVLVLLACIALIPLFLKKTKKIH